jgi:hypothetical protein
VENFAISALYNLIAVPIALAGFTFPLIRSNRDVSVSCGAGADGAG